ncbi:MAG: GGDEF domain-containing protein [Mesorhizobium sp.]
MRRILLHSTATTIACIFVSLGVIAALGIEISGASLWLPIICTAACAWPASTLTFYQNARLRRLNRQLAQANASLEIAHAALAQKASRDAMTGFLNREAFFAALDQTRRTSDRGVLLIIDADNFKRINDQYGHLKGDKALLLITEAIRLAVRDCDQIGRIGGEEFAVYLRGASLSDAAEISERLRSEVEKLDFRPRADLRHRLTVSIGGAVSRHRASLTDLMTEADARLYAAKNAGRNRVILPDEVPLAA